MSAQSTEASTDYEGATSSAVDMAFAGDAAQTGEEDCAENEESSSSHPKTSADPDTPGVASKDGNFGPISRKLDDDDGDGAIGWTPLVADALFLAGSTFMSSFHAREVILQCKRDGTADALYLCGSAALFLSALVELIVDLLAKREKVARLQHGRYTAKRLQNITVSAVFLAGVVVDLVVFLLWRELQDTENPNLVRVEFGVSVCNAVVWLVFALLILRTNVPSLEPPLEQQLESVGNLLMIVASVLLVIAISQSSPNSPFNERESKMELSSFSIMIGIAVMYLVADVLRLRGLSKAQDREEPS